MGATITTLTSLLKEFYIGPVNEELNNEIMVVQLMTKARVSWNGRLAYFPFHAARNSGVGFRAENATLPTAGNQTYRNFTLNAAFVYGRFEVSGPAIASAKSSGAGAFIGWMEAEMTRLKDDVRDSVNRAMVSGGRLVGFVTGHETGGTTLAFRGDINKLQAAIDAKGSAVTVQVIRLDRLSAATAYNTVSTGTVSATDAALGQITISSTTTSGGDLGWAHAINISDGHASLNYLDTEPIGIYGNLASQTLFGVARNAAGATPAPILQSTVLTQAVATGANITGVALSIPRIQVMFDQLLQYSGMEPDCLLTSPLQRNRYTNLLTATLQTWTNKAEKGDGGFSNLSYGNIPFKTSRHFDNGQIIFMTLKSWKYAELEPGGFADLDGEVLSRVSNADAWEGFYKWYYNVICTRPNCNGILTGLTLQ
ncbi:MAG: phage major capsid protein [Actinomycetales bacterium]|nr:phage major capsid protein [Actinomycetales bacterium]